MWTKNDRKDWQRKIETILHMAHKVLYYRRDKLAYTVISSIESQCIQLEQVWRECSNETHEDQIANLYATLDANLKKYGKCLYPINFWNENTEVLWVAAFLAIGFRCFFFQPFRIPTNSMFPSFSGMQTKLYANDKKPPNFLCRPFRWLFNGAESYYTQAPVSGTVSIPLFDHYEMMKYNSRVRYEIEYGRELGSLWIPWLFPKPYRVYLLYVNDTCVRIRVPFEFYDMEAVLRKKFFPQFESFNDILAQTPVQQSRTKGLFLNTSQAAEKGRALLHFDIFAGDMLFVNRISYHFRLPKVGEAVVFRTENIPNLGKSQYYIKRLVGLPGDQLEISQIGPLWRNGSLIEGSSAFKNNSECVGLYPGYRPHGLLDLGKKLQIPGNVFFVLGDNSPYSYDSRYWGFVPQKEVIGKACFVLHPFSWRWGKAEKDKSNPKADPSDYVFQ